LLSTLPNFFLTASIPFLIAGFTTLSSKSARGFANRADVVATVAMTAVEDITGAVGINCSTGGISSHSVIQIVSSGFNL
tara:strand:- start:21 stop:257 length:237 start_codon:yes stop_codon:yes gene_type:complete